MGRPFDEMMALLDARKRKENREHLKAASIRRAARDVVEDGFPCQTAARNHGVPVERVSAEVKRLRALATPPP